MHPWRTIGVFTLALVLAGVTIATLLNSGLTSEGGYRGHKPDSMVGFELIQDRLAGGDHVTDVVIVRNETKIVDDPVFKAYVEELAARIDALGGGVVESTATTYQTGDPSLLSKDKHATLISITMAGDTDAATKNAEVVHDAATMEVRDGFVVAQTGNASLSSMAMRLAEADLQKAEILGMPAALVVLAIVFGAVLAAFMPLGLSVVSIVLATALTALIGQVYPMTFFVMNILTMMGLAVCIDYTLFMISRYREERAHGLDKVDAIATTGATAGRAIFFSGMTVVLAMLGMVIVPLDVTISMGIGVMLVVITTLATALVLLPAILSLLGDHVNALRIPYLGRLAMRNATGGGVYEKLAHSIMRRPAVWLSVAVVVLLACALPVLFMHTGENFLSAASYPDEEYAKQGWVQLERDFSLGQASPTQIAIDGPADAPQVKAAVAELRAALARDVRYGPSTVQTSESNDLTVISTPYAGDPGDDDAQEAVKRLRSGAVASAFADVRDGDGKAVRAYVTGNTATVVDDLRFFDTWLPRVIALVLTLSFVLLTLAFRSIVIAAKAILMNLLSVGAAYGLMVLVFQKGVGAGLLGVTRVDTIEAWLPVFLFCMLFGLSMDYQVFLLSRIKERYDETGDTREAVGYGVGRTAGIITGAAAIMVCVFAGMASGELVMFQQWGFGLAVAILLDATIVRTIVVPAAMELLGDWNWYLPRWLQWLPNVSVEGRVDAHVPATPDKRAGGTDVPGAPVEQPKQPAFPRTAPDGAPAAR
jgi:RND superfamily putative drug exporter